MKLQRSSSNVLKATVRNVRTDNGTEFVNQTLRKWYENVGIIHQTSVARTPQQNGVVERQNQTLVEAARTMLIFSKALLFLWAEAINTASDIRIFVGYAPAKKAFRIYNRRTRIITETIHVTFDELITMASEQFSSGPGLQGMTPATSSTGLGSNPVSQQPCMPQIRDDWERLFQPMFDEYFNPPPIVVSPVQEAAALRAEVLADSPVSTSIDQDALSTSIPSSQEHEHSLIISQGFEESPKTPTFHDDLLNESPHKDSTSQGSSSNVRQLHIPLEHLGRWTKVHPIANVIDDPSRSNRLVVGKCNVRIPRGLKPKEEAFQVVLDALALTACYPTFIITADICPRVQGRDFDALPSKEDTISFLRDLGHTGVINSLNDVVVDQMHQPWRTFAALINRSLSGKTSALDKLHLSRAQIL
ncbi:integrase, catalytic region, zinc finger, CCHC-type containing protein [Tanacetum coccineum]